MHIADWIKRNWLVVVFLAFALNGSAQTTIINGVIRDANSRLPLSSVTVTVKNLKGGVTSDSAGNFSIRTDKPVSQLQFSIIGYKNQTVTVRQPPKPQASKITVSVKSDSLAHATDTLKQKTDTALHITDSTFAKKDSVIPIVTDTSTHHLSDTTVHRTDSVLLTKADTSGKMNVDSNQLSRADTTRLTDITMRRTDSSGVALIDSNMLQKTDTSSRSSDLSVRKTDSSVVKDSVVRPTAAPMAHTSTDPLNGDTLFVYMQPNSSLLSSVTVKNKKQKYRNKDNPAVELIRHVIDNKTKNRMESYEYAEYEKYEKLQLSLNNLSEKVKNSKLTKKYHFLFENADTTIIEGKSLLPVYLEEKISHVYFRGNPEKTKIRYYRGEESRFRVNL